MKGMTGVWGCVLTHTDWLRSDKSHHRIRPVLSMYFQSIFKLYFRLNYCNTYGENRRKKWYWQNEKSVLVFSFLTCLTEKQSLVISYMMHWLILKLVVPKLFPLLYLKCLSTKQDQVSRETLAESAHLSDSNMPRQVEIKLDTINKILYPSQAKHIRWLLEQCHLFVPRDESYYTKCPPRLQRVLNRMISTNKIYWNNWFTFEVYWADEQGQSQKPTPCLEQESRFGYSKPKITKEKTAISTALQQLLCKDFQRGLG